MAGIIEVQKFHKDHEVIRQQAGTEGKALVYNQQMAIPIALIVGSENPRHEPSKLFREGIKLCDPKDPKHSILHMALAEDIEDVKRLVELVESFENDPKDENEDKEETFKEDSEGLRQEQSIVSLARSMSVIQLQPVVVRPAGKDGTYVLLFGQRRLSAIAYWHAKSRLDVLNKVKGAKVFPPVIQATEVLVSKEQAVEMAIAENRDRKGFTDLQWGAIFYEYTQRKNPKTKKSFTLREITRKFFGEKRGSYGFVRNRHALMLPRTEPTLDDEGNVTKAGKGLTDEDRIKLENGEMRLTYAIHKALGEQHHKPGDGKPKLNRDRPLPLRDMQRLFDETAESNVERRQAIAECMNKTLEQATAESEDRIKQQDSGESRKGRRGRRKKEELTGAGT